MVDTQGKPIGETRDFGTPTPTSRGMAIEEPRFGIFSFQTPIGTPTPTSSEIPTSTLKTHTPNALINETSSYLQQNAHSPVKWRPWGEEAFKEARDAQAPIFLSIGYSTCSECYLMDTYFDRGEGVAEFLNTYFVCVKVDTDERPDVGKVYLEFVRFSVRFSVKDKGWPVNVFLSPDLVPLWEAFNTPSAFKYSVLKVKSYWYNEPPLPGSYPDFYDREYLIRNGNCLFREWSIQLFKNANWSQLKEDDPLLLLRGIVQKEADSLGGMLKRVDSEKDCPVKNVVKATSSTPSASSRAEPKRGLNLPEGSSNDDGLSQAGIKKTRLCKNHCTTKGCMSGGNCHFAHGKNELWKPRLPYHDPPQEYAASGEEGGGECFKMHTNAVCAGSIILGEIFSKTGAKLSVTLHESNPNLICVALEGNRDQIGKAVAIVGQRVRRVKPPSYREEYSAPSRLPVRAPPPVLVAPKDIFGF